MHSTTDRATARRQCSGLATLVRRRKAAGRPLPRVVVATVQEDILQWLLPDWVFFAGSGQVVAFEGPAPTPDHVAEVVAAAEAEEPKLSRLEGLGQDEAEVRELLRPRAPTLSVRRIASTKDSYRIFKEVFEAHHYMRGKLPWSFHGLLVCCGEVPVAFHASSCMDSSWVEEGVVMWRESRLVVLPEWQGFGIGPLVSDAVGDRMLASGLCFFSKTHHPRMGQHREALTRWRATQKNQVPVPQTSGGPPRRPYCHQYFGDTKDGNQLLKKHAITSADLVPREYWIPYGKQYYGLKPWKECFLFRRGARSFGSRCFFRHGRQ